MISEDFKNKSKKCWKVIFLHFAAFSDFFRSLPKIFEILKNFGNLLECSFFAHSGVFS